MNEQQFKNRTKQLGVRIIRMVDALPQADQLISSNGKCCVRLHRLARIIALPVERNRHLI